MKQYQLQPDNSNWVDKSPHFDLFLKALFCLCVIASFIAKNYHL